MQGSKAETLEDGRPVESLNGADPYLSLFEKISVQLGGIQKAHETREAERKRLLNAVWSISDIPVGQITAATGAGSSVSLPDIAGPRTGSIWYVTRITCQGITAGTVKVNYFSTLGPLVATIAAPASGQDAVSYFSPKQFPVLPNEWLVFSAGASWAGTTTLSIAVVNVLAEYDGLYHI
jgi:hypothetical protein